MLLWHFNVIMQHWYFSALRRQLVKLYINCVNLFDQYCMCAMASKLYDWDLRNVLKISPKFRFFSILLKTLYVLNELLWNLFTPYKGFICAIYQNRITGIRASEKQKVLIRLLYRTCGSGFTLFSIRPATLPHLFQFQWKFFPKFLRILRTTVVLAGEFFEILSLHKFLPWLL